MILTDSEVLIDRRSSLPTVGRAAEPRDRSVQRSRFSWRPLWMAWHLLSLDAPTVAVLWSRLMAQVVHVRVPWAETAILAGAVWLTYTADRILDGSVTLAPDHLRLRHRFAWRHRTLLIPAWGLVATGALWLCLFTVGRPVFSAGLPLVAIVLGYLCLVHLVRRRWFADWMKRALVGMVFSAGCLLPAWVHASEPGPLVLPGLAFAAVCFLNCSAIEVWESRRRQGRLGQVMAAAAGALLVLSSLAPASARTALVACTISVCGLMVLHRAQDVLSAAALRVLADAALLTAAFAIAWG